MSGIGVESHIEPYFEKAELVAALKCGDRITVYGGTVDMVSVSRDEQLFPFSAHVDYDPDFEVGHTLSFHISDNLIKIRGD